MLLIFIDFAFSRSPNEQILDDYQQLKLLNKINRMASTSLLKRSTTRIQRYAHFFPFLVQLLIWSRNFKTFDSFRPRLRILHT